MFFLNASRIPILVLSSGLLHHARLKLLEIKLPIIKLITNVAQTVWEVSFLSRDTLPEKLFFPLLPPPPERKPVIRFFSTPEN